jgi:hypothetical protein
VKWPDSQKYFNYFRLLILVSAFFLGFDQLFIRWRQLGEIKIVSIIGFFPQSLLENHFAFECVTWVFLAATALWAFRLIPKTTSIVSVLAFILSTSWYLQNEPFGDHRQSVFSFLLILLCLREFGLIKNYFYRTAGAIIISFYLLAGWEKVFYTGFSWPNGTSLQIFIHYMGYQSSRLGQLVLAHHSLAVVLQWTILIMECGAFMLFGPKPLRWVWLAVLLGFHIGIEEIFAYRYFLHFILVLYLFALPDVMESRHARKN